MADVINLRRKESSVAYHLDGLMLVTDQEDPEIGHLFLEDEDGEHMLIGSVREIDNDLLMAVTQSMDEA